MALELENRVVELVLHLTAADVLPTPDWLVRPGKIECASRWLLVSKIYTDLTGLVLLDVMRAVERRKVDLVLVNSKSAPRILEVDEAQHFNAYRTQTLRRYATTIPVAFDLPQWIVRSDAKRKLEGGGFAKPKPPLFPGKGGRHRQRAFRDALCDILPPEHGYLPTLRIGHFEVDSWVFDESAKSKMASLLQERGVL